MRTNWFNTELTNFGTSIFVFVSLLGFLDVSPWADSTGFRLTGPPIRSGPEKRPEVIRTTAGPHFWLFPKSPNKGGHKTWTLFAVFQKVFFCVWTYLAWTIFGTSKGQCLIFCAGPVKVYNQTLTQTQTLDLISASA